MTNNPTHPSTRPGDISVSWSYVRKYEEMRAENVRLRAENVKLRKVLECYADTGFEMARAALEHKP